MITLGLFGIKGSYTPTLLALSGPELKVAKKQLISKGILTII
ncbi:hypothetical protein Ct9H90mP29_05120 [bacterium]|nr:MAG: hypothetical protein Ct9H90mP29_05120 [bacterium]